MQRRGRYHTWTCCVAGFQSGRCLLGSKPEAVRTAARLLWPRIASERDHAAQGQAHHCRSKPSISSDSITLRSLRPFDCSHLWAPEPRFSAGALNALAGGGTLFRHPRLQCPKPWILQRSSTACRLWSPKLKNGGEAAKLCRANFSGSSVQRSLSRKQSRCWKRLAAYKRGR
jgi:hypothetical protein